METNHVGNRVAIIGAGVSGLTCGVMFVERGRTVTIFADETGQHRRTFWRLRADVLDDAAKAAIGIAGLEDH